MAQEAVCGCCAMAGKTPAIPSKQTPLRNVNAFFINAFRF
jgi:hypothetical protein